MKNSLLIHTTWAIIVVVAFMIGVKKPVDETPSYSTENDTNSGDRYTRRSQQRGASGTTQGRVASRGSRALGVPMNMFVWAVFENNLASILPCSTGSTDRTRRYSKFSCSHSQRHNHSFSHNRGHGHSHNSCVSTVAKATATRAAHKENDQPS